MSSSTTIPLLEHWRTAPSTDTLRSRYDASAHHWHENLARLGQLHDYQLLFESQAVRDRLNHLDPTSHILDCGMGTGAFSLALLDSIEQPAHISGVDISYPMLTHARQILSDRCATLDLRWGNIRRLPFADASFDAVIFAHVLEHMADPVATLREMVRVLKPGAPLVGSVTRQGLGQVLMAMRWHNRGYTYHQLDAFLQAAGLEAAKPFDYGTGWSKWTCIAVIGRKSG
ncbi:MAG: class I SAM-dependent methyltransferase [Cyanobacteria bacterium]|nr:class I SAM-dependent methyltransferase [Cyanobacteriota bacterium]MDA0867383.1 class I SAM-dependent methyltransferase [Cyanobacteriota bacterium]